MIQGSLFDDPSTSKFESYQAQRERELLLHLNEVKQKVMLAEDSIRLGGNANLVVPRLLRELRWDHLETMNLPRPTTGDLFQAINTALRFIVTTQLPDYKSTIGDGKTVVSKPKIERMSIGQANQALHILMKANDIYEGFCHLLDERVSEDEPENWVSRLLALRLEIENGL